MRQEGKQFDGKAVEGVVYSDTEHQGVVHLLKRSGAGVVQFVCHLVELTPSK
jgi:hypothetical protein